MHIFSALSLGILLALPLFSFAETALPRQTVRALYIPLADHYAAIVAYELYREEMEYADFHIEKMESWDLLRARFYEQEEEMAFVMAPLAAAMFQQKPYFKWIGLMHRDGNALAVNPYITEHLDIPQNREERRPTQQVASILQWFSSEQKSSVEVGVPHLLSTHSVVLYKYLRDNKVVLSVTGITSRAGVYTVTVAPSRSPAFLRGKNNKAKPAAFEQSLPWADIAETEHFGTVAWYSKDVMKWPGGHVECIALATNRAIDEKKKAIQEVMHYIRKAGAQLDLAREHGGPAMDSMITLIRRHVPEHTSKAILSSLNSELGVINYSNLETDKAGLRQVVDLALEAGILRDSLDIDAFCDETFNTFTREEYEDSTVTK